MLISIVIDLEEEDNTAGFIGVCMKCDGDTEFL